jgi:hypothetical protein
MAKKAHSKKTCAAQGWTACKGKGRPIPVGTLVAVRRFNGDTDTFMAGNQVFLTPPGARSPASVAATARGITMTVAR